MSDGDDDGDLHFLLAGGRLSGAQRERILDEVVAKSEARRPRRWPKLKWFAAGLVPAAAAAAALVVWTNGGHDRPRATAKGGASAAVLQARCLDREPGRCRQGDRLLFEVDGAGASSGAGQVGGGRLAAYAQDEAGERVWYFPAADGHLAAVPPAAGHVVVGEGARLGEEHRPGRYQVHLFLLDGATDRVARADLLAGRVHSRAEAVVPLQILPAP